MTEGDHQRIRPQSTGEPRAPGDLLAARKTDEKDRGVEAAQESTGAQEGNAQASAGAQDEDAAQALGEDIECAEERLPKSLFDPLKPTAAQVEAHELAGHCPYRNWCKICNFARGKEDPHKRLDEETSKGGLPEVGMDYDHIGNVEDDEVKITLLVMKDKVTGAL